VPQQSIDAFAEVTGDHQWIHVDPESAAAGPFGSTIAHGLFSLSLGPALSEQLLSLAGFAHSLNYGYDKVRFPAPLPVGSRVRMSVTIVAVEPVAAMGDALSAALPDVEVVRAAAEALPLADGSLDAVTAGQAFHWFDAPRALAEIHRVLRPGGLLAVIFNRRDLDTALQTEIDGLLAPYRGATPSWGDHGWRRALGSPTGFTAPEHLEFPNRQQVDADGLIGRVASVSFVATLPPEERAELDRELLRIFATHESDGSVTLAYRTELWRLRRER
jgi:acyl dehydratase